MQGELDEGNKDDDEDAINRRKFGPQHIRGGDRPKPPNTKYQFQRSEYAPQGIEPNSVMLDSRLATDMKSVSLPFPLIKLCDDQEQGGSWYLLGTQLILVRPYDDDLLMVREFNAYSDEHFNSYMATKVESEYEKIKSMLRTSH